MKAGIINVTGYAGSELARILSGHPEVQIASVTGRSAAGKRLPEVLPHLWRLDLPITRTVEGSVDIVFSTLPSGSSTEVLAPMIDDGVKAVDIAADFRLHDPADLHSLGPVDHGEPVQVRDLHIHIAGRAVRIGVEGERSDAAFEIDRPDGALRLRVNCRGTTATG